MSGWLNVGMADIFSPQRKTTSACLLARAPLVIESCAETMGISSAFSYREVEKLLEFTTCFTSLSIFLDLSQPECPRPQLLEKRICG
jgi:hypothetical protein